MCFEWEGPLGIYSGVGGDKAPPWRSVYGYSCWFQEAVFNKSTGKVILKTFSLYRKLLTLFRAGHDEGETQKLGHCSWGRWNMDWVQGYLLSGGVPQTCPVCRVGCRQVSSKAQPAGEVGGREGHGARQGGHSAGRWDEWAVGRGT